MSNTGQILTPPPADCGLLCTRRTIHLMGSLSAGPKQQEPGAGWWLVPWPAGVPDSRGRVGAVPARGQPLPAWGQTHTGLHHGV